jgi:predicted PurR-regulated permease PerM
VGNCQSIGTHHRPPTRRRAVALSERNERVLYALGICGLVILIGFIAYQALSFLASVPIFTFAVIGTIFFSYLIHPLIAWLRRRMPMAAAIAVVYVGIAFGLAFVFSIVAPIVSTDAQQIARDAPQLVTAGQRLLTDPNDPVTAHLPPPVHHLLRAIPVRIASWIGNYAARITADVLPVIVSFVAALAIFVIIPVAAAYMTAEAVSIKRSALSMLPPRARWRAARIITDMDHVVGGFIRGQLLVALIVGTLVTLLLMGLHVPYAVLVGVLAGIFDVIPYIGAIAGWLPAFFISYMHNGIANAIAVSLGIVVINQIEGHIVIPNVVSRTVMLTPLGVMLSLLLAGEILGLPGLLIAVPAAGVVRVLVINFTDRPRHEPHASIIPQRILDIPDLVKRAIRRRRRRR